MTLEVHVAQQKQAAIPEMQIKEKTSYLLSISDGTNKHVMSVGKETYDKVSGMKTSKPINGTTPNKK